VEVQKTAVCCWSFFFPRHLLPDTDGHAITAAMLSLRPVVVVKLHKCVDLLLSVCAKGKDVLLLHFALCAGAHLSTRQELPQILELGNPSLCCFVAWHSSPFVLIVKLQ